jgi:hypothetical protein
MVHKVVLFKILQSGPQAAVPAEKREQMLNDNTTNTLFGWIGDVGSLYIRPFVILYGHGSE